jgi:hypothetical protein
MNNTPNQSALVDAVRTVGHLLLSNGTTGTLARNRDGYPVSWRSPRACRFCYVGATEAVANKLELTWVVLGPTCDSVIGKRVAGSDWDSASPRTRKRWATKLANYEGE